MSNLHTVPLSNEEIQRVAPSAFAGQPYSRQSERYAFIPTSAVIDGLRDAGFFPVRATQSVARTADKRAFTKHLIRFRAADTQLAAVGDTAIETVLVNSHDGSSAYSLSLGVFRLACLNGLIVADALVASVHVRHVGNIVARVVEESRKLIQSAPIVNETIREWRGITLTQPEQRLLAEGAHALRFEEGSDVARAITPERILEPRRYADTENDLWTTFNRVQENVIKGGARGYAPGIGRRTSRPVKGIDQNTRLNRELWTLAARMAELKGGSTGAQLVS